MASQDLVISNTEYKERIGKIRGHLKRKRLKALYLTSPTRILYTTGFSHISTERPLALIIPQEGPIFLMGPHLEYDHVRMESPLVEEVHPYPDYPGKTHPMRFFAKLIAEKGLSSSAIAIDSAQGAAGGWGYRGPAISDLMLTVKFYDGKDIVDDMRVIKSKQELKLLRESAKWSQVAHDLLLDSVAPGTSDIILGLKASQETLARMLRKLGDKYRQLKWGLSPVVVGFRGQVGVESAIPHAVFTKKKIRKGDVLITEAGVEVGGYTSELERTVFLGKPSSKARRYFEAMLKAQSAALNEFRPGVPCRRIDDAAKRTIEAEGLGADLRHHTGHGIGLDAHEPPWLDPGEPKSMRVGMVFSCEPGLYIPGYAGFRHSDTVEITRSGMSFITEYPRGLDELTL
jgi:Xaa-Pro dipeptidase